jgi:hypothetical protein
MNVEIKNPPEEQETILSKSNAKTIAELEHELRIHTTKIKIQLHPFSTTRAIVRDIKLPDFRP